MPEITSLSAVRLLEYLAAGHVSAVEITQSFLSRIEMLEPRLHAFTDVFVGGAIERARQVDADRRTARDALSLQGVPIALKDLIEVRGHITAGGSKTWAQHRSYRTATVVRKLTSSGSILLGKTHTAEFALGGWGLNQHLGTPVNPWDTQVHRVPGGSSSGSAVAVAARMVPWAIGTDTGGSVRLPAAWCGVTGLRPSKGRISTYGIVPLSPTLDTPGLIARTVEDIALLFSCVAGPDALDPSTLELGAADVLAGLRLGVKGMRLGRLGEADLASVTPDVRVAYEAAISTLSRLGARIVPVVLSRPLNDFAKTSAVLMTEAHALYGDLAADLSLPMDDFVRRRLLAAREIPAIDYHKELKGLQQARAEFAPVLNGVAALLTPTTEMTAPAIDTVDRSRPPTQFTRCASILNLAALALPNGSCSRGLPISLQIMCREFDEATALRIGWSFQQVTDWHEQVPPMAAETWISGELAQV